MSKRIVFVLGILLFMARVSFSAPGDLDPTFGDGGVVRYPALLGGTYESDASVIIQPDGKILIASSSVGYNVLILRYNNDGTLDSSFNGNGIAIYNGNYDDMGEDIALQADGKIIVAGLTTGQGWDVLVLRYNSDGTLDSTFGEDGVVTFNNSAGNYNDLGRAVALQPDGKIVVVGSSFTGTRFDVLILRYNSDGTPDSTFGGGDGVATFSIASGGAYGYGVALQQDGKIAVVGASYNDFNPGTEADVFILRSNSDGMLDTSFGSNGVVKFNGASNGNDRGYGIAVQPDGKIVVAGISYGTYNDVIVLRYNSEGTPDSTFGGGDGIVIFNGSENWYDGAYDIAVQSDGKLLVTGFTDGGNLLALRCNSNGTPDSTFGEDGVVSYHFGVTLDAGRSIALQPDGNIVITGLSSSDGLTGDVLTLRLFAYPLGAATLISPSGIVTTTTPTYLWDAVSGSTNYYLWVDDSTGTKIQQWYTATEAGCGTGTGTCSVTPTTVLAPGACQWKIQTKNGTGDGPWSSPMLFTIQAVNIPDKTPPTPNQLTWVEPPHQTATNSISMVATTADDPTPPISYYFDFVGSPTGGLGGKDSGWQSGTSYTNSNLRANHKYGYRVKAKDGSNNQTTYSTTQYAYTAIQAPTGITFGTMTTPTSIQARSTNTPTGLSWGSSGLLIENTTNVDSSGWKRNNTLWTSKSLTPNTSYSFQAKARNGDGIETDYGPPASKYTRANLPGKSSFSDVTGTSIRANWTANGNPPGTQYLCQNLTTKTDSGWITETFWDSDNLACGISYNFRVKAKNQDGVETAWTSLGSQSCILVVKPNGGEMIPSGSNYDIQWETTPLAESFDLFYSLDSGVSWILIKKDERNTIYSWTVPKTTGNKKACLVKVVGYNAARTKKIGSDTSDKPFTIEVVTVLKPNGGEVFHAGEDATIEWRGCSDAVTFGLMVSLDNGLTWFFIDDETTPGVIEGKGVNGTSFTTKVLPPDTGNKTSCLIKVIAYNGAGKQIGSDASDKPFTIEVVKLTSPNGGGTPLKQKDITNITWTAYETNELITTVKLFYTKDGGATWNSIPGPSGTTYPPGNYSHSWTIPPVGTTPKTKCKVKVVLKDAKGVIRGSDVSDSYFTISP
jgi:uncharacterized delta-60 repeat protein